MNIVSLVCFLLIGTALCTHEVCENAATITSGQSLTSSNSASTVGTTCNSNDIPNPFGTLLLQIKVELLLSILMDQTLILF